MELTLSLTLDNGAIQLFWTYFIRFFVFVNGMRLDRLHEMYRPCLVNGNTPGGAVFFRPAGSFFAGIRTDYREYPRRPNGKIPAIGRVDLFIQGLGFISSFLHVQPQKEDKRRRSRQRSPLPRPFQLKPSSR
ncbi:hypothetical protein [Lawsonibacter faecis]|uniref:Uncharacterized protein n=1 Tax=Lawsonibacter faecis TaxID=2763052 RepID=A0A8J6MCR6_9FIRM|nr:hypothetical protein [Lawsonibacter faecis]MBC5737151.1 hypothetical protein [Lawsonibacter faecis]